jgi:hypothetical protein
LEEKGPEKKKAFIYLKNTKTRKPGEYQILMLLLQHHIMCPVEAVLQRIHEARSLEESLFRYYNREGVRRNLTKGRAQRILSGVWEKAGIQGISSHSFQVGGASFWFAMGIPAKKIQKTGLLRALHQGVYL